MLAHAQRLRANAEVISVGVLPNPSLVVEHQRTFTGPDERETILGVSVPLGISGRRILLQNAAEARRQQFAAEAHVTLFESALSFREAYVGAAIDQARAQVLTEQQARLEALSETVQALAESGETAGYDLLRQRTQARLHHGLVESAAARALASRALLEAWTGAVVEVPPIVGLDLAAGVSNPTVPVREPDSPRALSFVAASRASDFEARAARRRWVPDIDLFAGYRALDVNGDTAHGLSLSLTVPLGFFDHGQGGAARAEADRAVAEASAERIRQQDHAQAKAARVGLERLLMGIAELEQASIDAQALETQAKQLYAAGEAPITELLEVYRGAEEARLALLDRTQEIALSRLALMRAAGTMFDAGLDRACGGSERDLR